MSNPYLIILFFFISHFVSATTFRSVSSGLWSFGNTWDGGVSPGTSSGDTIFIKANVMLDVNFQSLAGCYIKIDSSGELCGHQSVTLNNSVMDVYGALDLDVLNVVSSQVTSYINSVVVLTQYAQISGTGASFTNHGFLTVGPWFQCSRSGAAAVAENAMKDNLDVNLSVDDKGVYYRFNSDIENVSVKIFTLLGQQIYQSIISGREGVIKLPAATDSFYILQIYIKGNLIKNQKFFLQE